MDDGFGNCLGVFMGILLAIVMVIFPLWAFPHLFEEAESGSALLGSFLNLLGYIVVSGIITWMKNDIPFVWIIILAGISGTIEVAILFTVPLPSYWEGDNSTRFLTGYGLQISICFAVILICWLVADTRKENISDKYQELLQCCEQKRKAVETVIEIAERQRTEDSRVQAATALLGYFDPGIIRTYRDVIRSMEQDEIGKVQELNRTYLLEIRAGDASLHEILMDASAKRSELAVRENEIGHLSTDKDFRKIDALYKELVKPLNKARHQKAFEIQL